MYSVSGTEKFPAVRGDCGASTEPALESLHESAAHSCVTG